MKISGYLPKISKRIDFSSLRIRLTLGIAIVSALGLSNLSLWTSWKMQKILITTHKQNIQYIAERFPHDVKIYTQMMSYQIGIQKTINNLTSANTLLWVKNDKNQTIAQSSTMKDGVKGRDLLLLNNLNSIAELKQISGRYWLLCATTLEVNQNQLGRVYIAQDITGDQTMFVLMIRNLIIASGLAIILITLTIAFYIYKSLQPLQTLSQLTANISAEKLGEVNIKLNNAPTEIKELAQTFEQMLMRLSESWEHQRQLVSNVSHELRTPLTLVSGYLQSTLRRGENLTEIQKEALKIAAAEAERTIQLLQDLLDLARADSGRMHLQMQPLILNDLVIEIVEMAKQYSQRLIKIESIPKLITIKADSNRLKQILLNLIDNAVKYSDIDLPIIVIIEKKNEQANIKICDRGIGIPLAQQSLIFERFYRVDEARCRSSGGAGLGLSIVKTLVEGMGGGISVRSQLGEGSTFTVSFPCS